MSATITLPTELEEKVAARAAAQGLPLEESTLRLIEEGLKPCERNSCGQLHYRPCTTQLQPLPLLFRPLAAVHLDVLRHNLSRLRMPQMAKAV
jgi:hypothetical protein